MNDLLTAIREKGFTASSIGEKIGQKKAHVSLQLSGKRTPTPQLIKELQSIGISLVAMANQEIKPEKPEAKKEPEKRAVVPQNAYEIFLASKDTVSSNQKRIYDGTIGKFLKSHNINSTSTDEINIYLNKIPGNQYGYSNRHLHWRNLRTFYKWLEFKYDFPNPIIDRKGNQLVPEPKINKESVMPSITREEVGKILASNRLDARDKLIVALPYASSMRVNEWSSLAVEDIDTQRAIARVRVKGGHIAEKTIALAMPYLKAYLAETGIEKGKLFQATAKYQELTNRRSFEGRLKYHIQPIARELTNNPKLILTPHVFRRGFARMAQESKIPDSMAMLLGGWHDIRVYRKYGNSLSVENAGKLLTETIKDIGLPSLTTA